MEARFEGEGTVRYCGSHGWHVEGILAHAILSVFLIIKALLTVADAFSEKLV
jgi:hypothetical protein